MRPTEWRALPAGEAVPLAYGLTVDSRSHLYMAIHRQTFQGSQADLAVTLLAQLALNMTRGEGAKPVKLPNPYYGAEARDKRSRHAVVPQSEKDALAKRLLAFSSIPE